MQVTVTSKVFKKLFKGHGLTIELTVRHERPKPEIIIVNIKNDNKKGRDFVFYTNPDKQLGEKSQRYNVIAREKIKGFGVAINIVIIAFGDDSDREVVYIEVTDNRQRELVIYEEKPGSGLQYGGAFC